jgi:SAM-dependent methyltransferase
MLAENILLHDETKLDARAKALKELAFLEEVVERRIRSDQRVALLQQIGTLRSRFEALNRQLFQRLRTAVQTGQLTSATFRAQLNRYTAYAPHTTTHVHIGYDALDILLNGICQIDRLPQPTGELAVEMVHLEATPARAVLDLLDRVGIGTNDLFYDIGAGLGQVAILVHLVSGMRAKGVEIEPAYVAYARACAGALGAAHVDFIQADAREVDYTDGTIFFMFTPFRGALLQEVLAKLHQVAQQQAIRVCTYGSCTRQVAQEEWLRNLDGLADNEFALAIFQSI